MTFGEALFSFGGRTGRLSFWLAALALAILVPAGGVVLFALSLAAPAAVSLFAIAFYLPLLWIALAVGTKRLHDRDMSAGWLLPFYLLPAMLAQIAMRMAQFPDEQGSALGFAVASGMFILWGIFELGFRRGTDGPNRFGPDPLAAIPTGLIDAPRHGNEEHALS